MRWHCLMTSHDPPPPSPPQAELLTVSGKDLLAHLQDHPATMLSLLRTLSMRVRAADAKIRSLGFLDVAGRLATSLLELDQPPGQRATITIRHVTGAMAGTIRQTVSEILDSRGDRPVSS